MFLTRLNFIRGHCSELKGGYKVKKLKNEVKIMIETLEDPGSQLAQTDTTKKILFMFTI